MVTELTKVDKVKIVACDGKYIVPITTIFCYYSSLFKEKHRRDFLFNLALQKSLYCAIPSERLVERNLQLCIFLHYMEKQNFFKWQIKCRCLPQNILLFVCLLAFFIFKIILLLFNYSCLHLPPTSSPHPSQTHLPPLIPHPAWLCPCVLYSCSWKSFPHLSSHLPSGYCQFVLNFDVSGYILLAFFFCWLGSS